MMIKKIDHVVITTVNPSLCMDFYRKLGFEAKDAGGRYELFAGDFKINVHIKDHELSPHAQNIQSGSADLCFEIDGSILLFQENLEKMGLNILSGVVKRNGVKGAMLSVYLRDPDGNLLEFSSYE